MQWRTYNEKVGGGVENINLILQSDFVELLNIPLHCHNIDKAGKKMTGTACWMNLR